MQNLVETVEICFITKHDVCLEQILIVGVNACTNSTVYTQATSQFTHNIQHTHTHTDKMSSAVKDVVTNAHTDADLTPCG